MRKLASGIYSVALLALGLSLGGCVDESPWGGASSESGSISLDLTTDEGIYALKPLVRSGETRAITGTEPLSNYNVTVPTAEDFTITLVNPDGTTTGGLKLSDFKSKTFPVGVYTLTASSGDKGTHGFDKPYFEGSATFTVLADRTREIKVATELANFMIKASYEKAFQDYMDEYYLTVKTNGMPDSLNYTKDKQQPVFIDPENSTVTLHFTTWRGKTANLEISGTEESAGKFKPTPKTLHNLKFDVTKGADEEDETLSITFNDAATEETVNIDMTTALAPGPEIACTGFEENQTLDLSENTVSELKMDVSVPAGMRSANLTIASEPANSFGWPDNTIDLCTTNVQLSDYGIFAKGFGNGRPETNVMASLDLKGLCSNLPSGEHTITLLVTDKNGNTRTSGLVLNNKAIALIQDSALPAESKSKANFGNNNVEITLDYNGQNPSEELTFFSQDGDGTWQKAELLSAEELPITTRAYATKRYKLTLQVAETALKQINVRTYRRYSSGNVYDSSATPIGEFAIPVTLPEYSIQVDAFSYYAFLKINADESAIPTIVKNLQLNGISVDKSKYNSTGYLVLSGLTANKSYSGIQSSITAGTANWDSGKVDSFTTEAATAIPNGDFSNIKTNDINIDIQVGGQFIAGALDYTITSSIKRDTPLEWATINDLTAYKDASNKNSWFVAPSTYIENEEAILETVGYSHNGTTPAKTGSFNNRDYFCTNTPSKTELQVAPGELFLGTYSYNGKVNRTDGITFTDRPSSISFQYKYTRKSDEIIKDDMGVVLVKVLDSSDNAIASTELFLEPTQELTKKTINLDYKFGIEAAKIIIGNFYKLNICISEK